MFHDECQRTVRQQKVGRLAPTQQRPDVGAGDLQLGNLMEQQQAAGMLLQCAGFQHPVQADEENVVTVVSGTDAADTMTLTDPIDAQAGLLTDQSEKIEASATALDALAGSDVILSGADVAASADATALLWQILDAKTQALAKAMGLVAGDDNDMLTSSGALAVTSVANGAYAGALAFDSGDRDGDDRKIDLSLITEAGSTAIDGRDGDDMVNNDGALAAIATATSGGTVDQLTADVHGHEFLQVGHDGRHLDGRRQHAFAGAVVRRQQAGPDVGETLRQRGLAAAVRPCPAGRDPAARRRRRGASRPLVHERDLV